MARKKKWSELSSRKRRLIVFAAVFDTALKAAALIDIKRRPADQIRGSKTRWATSVALVNSVGALPTAYFVCGRKRGGRP